MVKSLVENYFFYYKTACQNGGGGEHAPEPLRGSCQWNSLLPPPTFIVKPSYPKLIENPELKQAGQSFLIFKLKTQKLVHTERKHDISVKPNRHYIHRYLRTRVASIIIGNFFTIFIFWILRFRLKRTSLLLYVNRRNPKSVVGSPNFWVLHGFW